MKARIQHRKADRESRGSCDDFLRRKSEGGGGASASTDRRSVFLSGSRSRAVIPKVVQDSLETIMSNGFNILIGDSDKGVDKEIIDFLCVPLYENVVLYSVPPRKTMRRPSRRKRSCGNTENCFGRNFKKPARPAPREIRDSTRLTPWNLILSKTPFRCFDA